ncbi:phosphoribosyltransferase [Marinifilum flexuosum]|uniref:phosphoribosyltransferase n=1 Tax=Marinifilum flexuosum TaxID=1117708 RepID=UPI0024948BC0|nr:phosphoribosyltransferase [Marinifilum flexuosum]
MKENSILKVKFGKKFTSKDIDLFVEENFSKSLLCEHCIFDLTEIEWIPVEEVTFLFGWIRYVKNNNKDLKSFKVNFAMLSPVESNDNYIRRRKRLLNLWNIWKIWDKCELNLSKETNLSNDINKYIDVHYQYDSNWHNIVPFTKLDSKNINDLRDLRGRVERNIYDRFNLSSKINKLLSTYSALSPFENKALSGIISTELFLNSIIHAYDMSNEYKECYFAISLRNKINTDEYKIKKQEKGINLSDEEVKRRINFILKNNLKEKHVDEKSFFMDEINNSIAINESFVEFTFLDFGKGIPSKLRNRYLEEKKINQLPLSKKHFFKKPDGNYNICEDSRILEYAFLIDSSSNPFDERLEINNHVPRGLYFLVDIIRRYNGLLIVRSGNGKVIFNFKSTNKISEAVYFSECDSELPFFQGTLMSIYLPSKTSKELLFNKLELNLESVYKKENKETIVEYINISELIKFEGQFDDKGITQLYNNVFRNINKKIDSFKNDNCTVYLDFSGTEDVEIVNRKIYFYICNTPRFNSNTKVVIVHPSNYNELLQTKEALKKQKNEIYRPIPCFLKGDKDKVHIIWLGISSDQDEQLLNSCISNDKSYNIDKFEDKTGLVGNVIRINESDFVTIDIAGITNILEYYNPDFMYKKIPEKFLEKYLNNDKLVSKQPKILLDDEKYIYWTAGGYYQKKFLTLLDLLYDYEIVDFGNFKRGETENTRFGERVARYLIEKYNYLNESPLDVDYIITVTLSSQLLGQHIKDTFDRFIDFYEEEKKKPKLIRLTNYHSFDIEKTFSRIKEGKKILIVNDVISTGRLSNELYQKLTKLKKAQVKAIFSVIDSREQSVNKSVRHYDNDIVEEKTYSLVKYPIKKYKSRKNLFSDGGKQVVTIDPVINTPSMMKLERGLGNNILFSDNEEKGNSFFLKEYTEQKELWVGHFEHNQAHHSYFFKTDKILTSPKGEKLIKEIFKHITFVKEGIDYIFYPMFSAIEDTSENLPSIISENSNFLAFPLPRIDTPKGWRFAFPPKVLNAKGSNFRKRNVVIIDDGSCSGDTLLQMIDSVAMIEVNEIVAVSVVARLEDFQREFFSRLSSIKGFKKYQKEHLVSQGEDWDLIAAKYKISPSELLKANININSLEPNIKLGIPLSQNTNKEIPVKVIFGTHFHIPVYSPLKNCPFCDERNDLKRQLNSNIPEPAKGYILKRIKELEPFSTDGYSLENGNKKYKGLPSYFPDNFDVKELIIARDIIGKIDTYRLYRDYIKDEYSSPIVDYYLAVILHEERLIESISHLLPHLKYRLLDAIKLKLGIKIKKLNDEELQLQWDNVSLLKLLWGLDETAILNEAQIKKILKILDDNDDIAAIDFICFKYWSILRKYQDIPAVIRMSLKTINENTNGNIRKRWRSFLNWIIDNKDTTYKQGYSFKYLKDIYTKKLVEHPNHHTNWVEFYNLERKILAIKQLPFKEYLNGDFIEAKELFDRILTNFKPHFLDIIEDKEFKSIINYCGQTEAFYGENNSAKKLLDIIASEFEKRDNSNLEIISEKLNRFITIYLDPNSNFAKFFLEFEIRLLNAFKTKEKEFAQLLKQKNITYNAILNVDNQSIVNLHPKCFSIILDELYTNCINHSKGQNTSIECILDNSPQYIIIKFIHLINRDNSSKPVFNGLSRVKAAIVFFGGKFETVTTEREFSILLKIPKKDFNKDYNF